MIIPWRVDVPQERLPFVNWLIIAGAIAAFAGQTFSVAVRSLQLGDKISEYADRPVEDVVKDFKVPEKRLKEIEGEAEKTVKRFEYTLPQGIKAGESRDAIVKRLILEEFFVWGKVKSFVLHGWSIKGLFGHAWLHGGIIHLLGNLLFLWIFGNAVCAKIGNVLFLPVYVLLGLIAGVAHLVFTGGDAIGASGAINGIVGMFLVFFPQNEITCYFILFIPLFLRPIIKELCVSSGWMILLWFGFDIWGLMRGGGQIAYFAHIGGFVGGFVLAVLMLKFGFVTMERYEKSLLQLIDEYRHPLTEEFKSPYDGYLGMIEKESQGQAANAEQVSASAAAKPLPFEPKTISFEPPVISESPGLYLGANPPKSNQPRTGKAGAGEEFIRFACACGKHLKMPAKYGGRMGKCPKCNARIRIPDK
ncbi:MAG: rhomboid family intramembrane serine protease [Sedimentisphaerales bacterium]|nr:rhomboid family intramembrane serine protease [Sedimentisphaerales bacterium]